MYSAYQDLMDIIADLESGEESVESAEEIQKKILAAYEAEELTSEQFDELKAYLDSASDY